MLHHKDTGNWTALIVCAVIGITTLAQAEITIIAQEGDAAPDANGAFSLFNSSSPVLNDAGQVAFEGFFTGTSGGSADDGGLFRGSGGTLTQVAREGAAAPDANGTFSFFDDPAINDAGQLAFEAFLTGTAGGGSDDGGIFRGSGGALTQIAREGGAPPEGNGTFSSFLTPNLNDLGQVAFLGNLTGTSGGGTDNAGVYVGSGSGLMKIAREADTAHDGDGTFSSFNGDPAINNLGQVAFVASYTGNSGGGADNNLILRGTNSSNLTDIAREGDLTPGGNGTLGQMQAPAMNDSGQVAFENFSIQGASGGSLDDERIFRGSGGSLTEIQREGEAAPDGNGVFNSTQSTSVRVNNSNRVAFWSSLRDTAGGSTDDSGIFLGSGGTITQIVREGGSAPDGNGVFGSVSSSGGALNSLNHVAFEVGLTGTSGGGTDNNGVFIGDGVEVVRVVREGQALAGSTVTLVNLTTTSSRESDERTGLNDFGQVAFWASLANGNEVVGLFTPDLHWREDGSGFWSTDSDWTLGIEPDALYHTFIDPNGSVNVTGNHNNGTVKSLTVGSTGGGVATLELDNTGDLHSLGDVQINADGRIEVAPSHVLSSDTNINNAGTLDTDGTVDATMLTNTGVLTGSGTVTAIIDNQASGEVRVDTGESLQIANGGAHTNAGTIRAFGGDLEITGALTNAVSTGLIAARDAILQFSGGLTNHGSMGLSFGTTDVFGDITNSATGQIVVSGNSNATFWEDVANAGSITTSTGSTSVFFGSVSGAGSFPGGGTNFFEGDLAPGASPSSVQFGGDVVLGPFTKTHIELGGTTPGSQHDQLDVTGDLTIGGTLNVTLIDAGGGLLNPQAGDFFDILNFASISGDFTTLNLPALDLGLMWNVGFLKTTGELLSTFMGDINGDLSVGVTDLGLLANQWGTGGFGQFTADITGDGIVSVTDLGALAANWGAMVGPSLSSATVVPAPSAMIAGGTLLIGVGLRRKRR